MNAIVKDGKKLNQVITQAINAGVKYHELLHTAAVSALYHAVTHGDCRPLDRLFDSMSKNNQTAMKLYVTRINYEVTDARGTAVLKHTKDGFSVLRNDENASAAKWKASIGTLCEKNLISCEGKWKPDAAGKVAVIAPFHETDNYKEIISNFTDASVLKMLVKVKRISEGNADAPGGGEVILHPDTIAAIDKALTAVKRVTTDDGEPAAMAKNVTKAKNAKVTKPTTPKETPAATPA